MNIKCKINQTAALRAGINAPHSTAVIDIDPATLTAAAREYLSAVLTDGHDATKAGIDSAGNPRRETGWTGQELQLIVPSADGLRAALAEILAESATRKAAAAIEATKRAQEADARVQALLDAPPKFVDEDVCLFADGTIVFGRRRYGGNYLDTNYVRVTRTRLVFPDEPYDFRFANAAMQARWDEAKRAATEANNLVLEEARPALQQLWAAKEAREAKEAKEAKVLAEQRAEQLKRWIAERATDAQRKRHARGLLLESEVLAGIKADAFAPLAGYTFLSKPTAEEIRAAYEGADEDAETEWVEVTPETASDAVVELAESIEAALPTVTTKIVCYVGRLTTSSADEDELHQLVAYGVAVTLTLGTLTFTRTYAAQ